MADGGGTSGGVAALDGAARAVRSAAARRLAAGDLEGAHALLGGYLEARADLDRRAAMAGFRLNGLLRGIALAHGVRLADLRGPCRAAHLVDARADFVRRAREGLGVSWMRIGRAIGRDHSTVIHLYRRRCREVEP